MQFPSDLIPLINDVKSLPVREILSRGQVNKQFYNSLCKNPVLWRDLVHERLTDNEDIISSLGLQQMKEDLHALEKAKDYLEKHPSRGRDKQLIPILGHLYKQGYEKVLRLFIHKEGNMSWIMRSTASGVHYDHQVKMIDTLLKYSHSIHLTRTYNHDIFIGAAAAGNLILLKRFPPHIDDDVDVEEDIGHIVNRELETGISNLVIYLGEHPDRGEIFDYLVELIGERRKYCNFVLSIAIQRNIKRIFDYYIVRSDYVNLNLLTDTIHYDRKQFFDKLLQILLVPDPMSPSHLPLLSRYEYDISSAVISAMQYRRYEMLLVLIDILQEYIPSAIRDLHINLCHSYPNAQVVGLILPYLSRNNKIYLLQNGFPSEIIKAHGLETLNMDQKEEQQDPYGLHEQLVRAEEFIREYPMIMNILKDDLGAITKEEVRATMLEHGDPDFLRTLPVEELKEYLRQTVVAEYPGHSEEEIEQYVNETMMVINTDDSSWSCSVM